MIKRKVSYKKTYRRRPSFTRRRTVVTRRRRASAPKKNTLMIRLQEIREWLEGEDKRLSKK